jgi:hypothetical protein
MKVSSKPVRATILYGMLCALSFIPLNLAFSCIASRSDTLGLTVWWFLAGYTFLLSRLSEKSFWGGIYPLLLLFTAIFATESVIHFSLLALPLISWIRSGIFFQKPVGTRLVTEVLLVFTCAVLGIAFAPGSPLDWVLGIWMFFLVQALYFVLLESDGPIENYKAGIDPFDKASRQAEAVLSEVLDWIYEKKGV